MAGSAIFGATGVQFQPITGSPFNPSPGTLYSVTNAPLRAHRIFRSTRPEDVARVKLEFGQEIDAFSEGDEFSFPLIFEFTVIAFGSDGIGVEFIDYVNSSYVFPRLEPPSQSVNSLNAFNYPSYFADKDPSLYPDSEGQKLMFLANRLDAPPPTFPPGVDETVAYGVYNAESQLVEDDMVAFTAAYPEKFSLQISAVPSNTVLREFYGL